jgi:hypothetical protein
VQYNFAVADRPGGHRLDIRTRAGLGHGQRGDRCAAGEPRQPPALLLAGGVVQEVGHADVGLHAQAAERDELLLDLPSVTTTLCVNVESGSPPYSTGTPIPRMPASPARRQNRRLGRPVRSHSAYSGRMSPVTNLRNRTRKLS